jgi:hypothetical protein
MVEAQWSATYEVVDRVTTLPGRIEAGRDLLMVGAPTLFELIGGQSPVVPADRADDRDGNWRTALWTTASGDELDAQLASLGIAGESQDSGTRSSEAGIGGVTVAERAPLFVAFRATLPYLRVIGVLALALGCAGAVLHAARARQSLAVETLLLRTIGVGRSARTVAMVAELMMMAVLAAVFGSLIAVALVRFLTPRLDPDPALLPAMVPQLSVSGLAIGAVAVLGAAVVTALGAQVLAGRAGSEVLRVAD